MRADDVSNRAATEGETDLVSALRHPDCYPHPVQEVRVLETHISWVLLTGTWAYKIKKPVNLGFLDFTTLESRRHFCEEELRLNRRLAPQIYEAVVEIRGTPDRPRVEGPGPVLEYAVKMREFAQEALASNMLARGALAPHHVDLLARSVAEFHAGAERAGDTSPFGAPDAVLQPALQNFEQLLPCLQQDADRAALQSLRDWTEREYAQRQNAFAARRREGHVRQCHGDLHLRNIAVLDGHPVAFDCIEFDDQLRWIDVMSEVAFLVMDFEDRGSCDLAWRLLNGYLEATGDYLGVGVLRFYLVYRALVRAKVHALRARQPGIEHAERQRLGRIAREYLGLAARFSGRHGAALVITHGLSGSGKTSATQALLGRAGAVRVRSDIERKRLHGIPALARSNSGPGAGLYTKEATVATYQRLLLLARAILEAGYPAVVDAAFLKRGERDAFRALAASLRVPFLILAFDAPEATLRERVAQRLGSEADASEADLAVLERQLAGREPIAPDETLAITIDTRQSLPAGIWEPVLQRLA
jgi:aminoglycoside phosphotransferase family enzyme/predicted kinase